MIPQMVIPDVPIELKGQTIHLRADFNGLAYMEQNLGVSFLDGEKWVQAANFQRMKATIDIVHALTRTRHPDLERGQIGRLIDMKTLPLIAEAMRKVMSIQISDPQEPAAPANQEPTAGNPTGNELN